MICYQCRNQIKREFSKFCDHCGSNLEIKPKTSFAKKEIAINIDDEMERAANLFLLWNANIVATFIFYIIHIVTDSFAYLFMLALFMCLLSWILLLTKLHDLALRQNHSTKKFILTNFGAPVLGTFYSFIKLTQKLKI
jgi:hypothetical protein